MILKKEDVSIKTDGTVEIINDDLKAKIERFSATGEEAFMDTTNNCNGGNCARGCSLK